MGYGAPAGYAAAAWPAWASQRLTLPIMRRAVLLGRAPAYFVADASTAIGAASSSCIAGMTCKQVSSVIETVA